MGRLFSQASPAQMAPFSNRFVGRVLTPPWGVGDAAPYKCYRLLPGWLFRFIIIPNKYTPYTAIATALTQADNFNPGVW